MATGGWGEGEAGGGACAASTMPEEKMPEKNKREAARALREADSVDAEGTDDLSRCFEWLEWLPHTYNRGRASALRKGDAREALTLPLNSKRVSIRRFHFCQGPV